MNTVQLLIEECYITVDEETYKQMISNVDEYEIRIVRKRRVYNMWDIYTDRSFESSDFTVIVGKPDDNRM